MSPQFTPNLINLVIDFKRRRYIINRIINYFREIYKDLGFVDFMERPEALILGGRGVRAIIGEEGRVSLRSTELPEQVAQIATNLIKKICEENGWKYNKEEYAIDVDTIYEVRGRKEPREALALALKEGAKELLSPLFKGGVVVLGYRFFLDPLESNVVRNVRIEPLVRDPGMYFIHANYVDVSHVGIIDFGQIFRELTNIAQNLLDLLEKLEGR